jgi:peptide/nickel transport system substrate-binding protein
MMLRRLLFATAATLTLAGAAGAETLRYAGTTPALTMDPHATNDFVTTAIFRQVYDSLTGLDLAMNTVPGLATAWEYAGDNVWRFTLRDGVTFHDGSALTGEDVAFSILRAKDSRFYTALFGGITEVRVPDPLTVEVVTSAPDPILPRKMTRMFIMSKAWAEANGAVAIPDLGAEGAEAFSVRNANGTGPMKLVSHDPQVRTEFARFEGFWDAWPGNLDGAVYTPIGSGPTRLAALLSGEVDLITDLPIQDVERVAATAGFAVTETPQLLAMQLEMDGTREAALDTFDKAGAPLNANPFRDTRVRQAIAHAVDANLIVDRVMRGHGRVIGTAGVPGIDGYQEDLDVRWPTDLDLAKSLLTEAGYPEGFATTLNCPTERYVNTEEICRAVASMLARIGIDVRVNTMVWPDFARMLVNGPESSFHLIGSGSNSWDAQDTFTATMQTRNAETRQGFFNWALYSNPEVDEVAAKLPVTFDPAERTALYRKGLIAGRDTVHAIYLHQPTLIWAMRDGVTAPMRGDATLTLQNVTMAE